MCWYFVFKVNKEGNKLGKLHLVNRTQAAAEHPDIAFFVNLAGTTKTMLENAADIFAGQSRLFSWGLVITVVIFALRHLVSSGGLFNAVYTGFIFLILGLIFKYSQNIYGPMLAWTLINGQVCYMARLLFQ